MEKPSFIFVVSGRDLSRLLQTLIARNVEVVLWFNPDSHALPNAQIYTASLQVIEEKRSLERTLSTLLAVAKRRRLPIVLDGAMRSAAQWAYQLVAEGYDVTIRDLYTWELLT